MRVMLVVLPMLFLAESADAQLLIGRRLGVGVYGGVALPMNAFKTDATMGWHAGGTVETDLVSSVDLRLDGGFARFGDKDFELASDVVTQSSEVIYGTLNLELNLGIDSAAYPGDNTVSPWMIGGAGLYGFDIEAECTEGSCSNLDLSSISERKFGLNIGAGATVPLAGLRTFVEARYHRVFWDIRGQGSIGILLLAAGIKFN